MKLSKLYIFVEGNDDERFFKHVIVPLMYKKYNDVEIFKYAQWKKEKVNNFINSIKTLQFDYIFTADLDDEPSVGSKKKRVHYSFANVDDKRISIVIHEIESWYIAGFPDDMLLAMKLPEIVDSESITKEDFNQLYHQISRSRIDFMRELLKNYSIKTASEKNSSFKHFVETYVK